jgi:glycosyltransferase involved in cell wall biosynthesis
MGSYSLDLKVAIGTWEAPPALGGPAYYIKELVERLSNYVDVELIIPSYASVKEKDGLVTRKIASIDIPIVRVCMFAARASLLVKKLGVDIVHDNGVLGFSNFSPFIETWHHSNVDDRRYLSASAYYLSFYRELLTLRGIKKADSIIAVSSTAKADLINHYFIPSSKIHVAPLGVDVDFFRPLLASKISGYSKQDGKIYLLYVGALGSRKNVGSLIRALKIIVNKRNNVHLLIVGAGGEKNRLQELTEILNLTKHLTFLGAVSREHLLELYNIADYVVLPSYKEGFGMTMLEALACEKPVIMTPVGISDIIKSNNLGIVADNFTPSSLAYAIEAAISEGEFNNLRTFVTENFSWSKTVETTLQVYKQTLENC